VAVTLRGAGPLFGTTESVHVGGRLGVTVTTCVPVPVSWRLSIAVTVTVNVPAAE